MPTEPTAIVPEDGVRPGYNETGSTLAKRRLVKKVAGTDQNSVALAGDGDSVHGVTMNDIANGKRGDVQLTGKAIVTSGAAFARGVELTSDANGKAITAVSGDYIFGISDMAADAADQDVEAELAGPSSGRIKA